MKYSIFILGVFLVQDAFSSSEFRFYSEQSSRSCNQRKISGGGTLVGNAGDEIVAEALSYTDVEEFKELNFKLVSEDLFDSKVEVRANCTVAIDRATWKSLDEILKAVWVQTIMFALKNNVNPTDEDVLDILSKVVLAHEFKIEQKLIDLPKLTLLTTDKYRLIEANVRLGDSSFWNLVTQIDDHLFRLPVKIDVQTNEEIGFSTQYSKETRFRLVTVTNAKIHELRTLLYQCDSSSIFSCYVGDQIKIKRLRYLDGH